MSSSPDFVMSARAVRKEAFTDGIAAQSTFLVVPSGKRLVPKHKIAQAAWYQQVQQAAEWKNAAGQPRGDVLFVVHGFNNSEAEIIDRHRRIKRSLAELGFRGVVVSFDWPCGESALAYLHDRQRARETAWRLIEDGIAQLAKRQTPDCPINIHVLGHSMGAYVIREAFEDADDYSLAQSAWLVSQVMLAAGDVSSGSMDAGDSRSRGLYNHCVRLTNYSNRHDKALDISNIKRLGIAPRVGRNGLPDDAPAKAVNIDCSAYYATLDKDAKVRKRDQPEGITGTESHSWHFGNRVFTRDLFNTLIGIDNTTIPTRVLGADGKLELAWAP